ncbi:MAG: hypothetical protein AMXMBFR33_41720 [Candidatus Xenobia bacterium]
MARLILKTPLEASAEEVFAWHSRPGALQRLLPPWQDVRLEQSQGGLEVGARRTLSVGMGPLRVPMRAVHTAYEPGRGFQDVLESGPFRTWKHHHRFYPRDENGSVLEDEVEFSYHGGKLLELLVNPFVIPQLHRMFTFRHRRTRQDLERHAGRATLRVGLTGSSGFLGSGLAAFLESGAHTVIRFQRQGPVGPGVVCWDPATGECAGEDLEGLDAVVHLAGENIGGHRWNAAFKSKVRSSRVQATEALCRTLAALRRPPACLLSASAIGYYGSSEAPATEQREAGQGFLAEVCQAWEQATRPAEEAGIRVAHLRIGTVLGAQGGALARLLPVFRMGGGGALGTGRQGFSWISREDAIGAIHWLLYDQVSGPVNVVAPNPVSNEEFTRTLARVLGRPALLRLDPWLLRLVVGEFADEALLSSQWVLPARLQEQGFRFLYPDLEDALRAELGRFTLKPEGET